RGAAGARGCRASARCGLPDVETTLPQRRLHPVDLALPDPLRACRVAGRRADVKALAGGAQGVDIRGPERPDAQGLGRQVGAGFHGLELAPEPAQVRLYLPDGL